LVGVEVEVGVGAVVVVEVEVRAEVDVELEVGVTAFWRRRMTESPIRRPSHPAPARHPPV
jgi:hypothetical protein